MSSVARLSPFLQIPKVLQDGSIDYLSIGDVEALSQVSKYFNEKLNHPQIWIKVAAKINLTITKTPKEDVIAYYHRANCKILRDLDPNYVFIGRTGNPFLQLRAIERYIKKNILACKEHLRSRLGPQVPIDSPETVKLLMSHLSFNCEDYFIKNYAISSGSLEITKMLIEHGAVFKAIDIRRAVQKNHLDLGLFLVEMINIKTIDSFDFGKLVADRCSVIVRALLVKGIAVPPQLIEKALDQGDNEIVAILQEFIPNQAENEDVSGES